MILADEHEVLGVLQLRLGRRGLPGGLVGKRAETAFLAAAGMADATLFDRDFGGRHPPFLGRGGDQHGACGGARCPVLLIGIGNRRRPACALHAEQQVRIDLVVGRRMHRPHLAPVRVQFLGNQRGEAGKGPLSHFDVLAQDRHRVVGSDLDECVHDRQRIVAAAIGSPEDPCVAFRHDRQADDQARTGDEGAARRTKIVQCHGFSPPSRRQHVGGVFDRLPDALVGGAATDVAGHGAVDVGVRGLGRDLQERHGGHDLP